MKRLITFLLFIGLFAMATNVQANESWFKTLTKSETSFVIGGGFEVGLYSQKTYQFQTKVFNHYVGYSILTNQTFVYDDNYNVVDINSRYNVYYGYGFNLGNIYELIHNSDDFGYKVFNRINVVPTYKYEWLEGYGNKHKLSYIIDVDVIRLWKIGLNLQLTDSYNLIRLHSLTLKKTNDKLLFLNFNLRF